MFRKSFSYSASAIKDDYIYFSLNLFNGLFKMHVGDYQPQYVGRFPDEDILTTFLHRAAYNFGNEVIFIPNKGSNIHFFDTSNCCWSSVNLSKFNMTSSSVIESCIKNGILYIVSRNGKTCCSVNLATKSVTEEIVLKEFFEHSRASLGYNFINVAECRDYIFLGLCDKGTILKYDVVRKEIDLIDIGIKNIHSMYAFNEEVYICDKRSNIYKLTENYCGLKEDIVLFDEEKAYNRLVFTTKGILFLPQNAEKILLKKDKEIIELAYPKGFEFIVPNVSVKFWDYLIVDEILLLSPQGSDYLLTIDIDRCSVTALNMKIEYNEYKDTPYKDFYEMWIMNFRKKNLANENIYFNLEDFIDLCIR